MKLLYQNTVKIVLPFVGVFGKIEPGLHEDPALGLADIHFSPGSVEVKTIYFDDIEEVSITIYEGLPGKEDIPPETICASGLIEVDDGKITLHGEGFSREYFNWPNGLTDVVVLLKASEVLNHQTRSITFYLRHFMRVRPQNGIAKIFQRR